MSKGTVNKVTLIGRLGADPEIKYAQGGMAFGHLRLATTETFKDKNTGQAQDQTEWHRVALFGKTAEIAGEWLKKGSSVYIEGRIRTNKWKDQSGQDRYTTEIVANEMQFIGGSKDNSSGETSAEHSESSVPLTAQVAPGHDDKFVTDDAPF